MEQIAFSIIQINELLEKINVIIDKRLNEFGKQMQKSETRFITGSETAKRLKISLPTLREWTKLGWLNAYKIGRRVLYDLEEVEQAVKKRPRGMQRVLPGMPLYD